MIDQFSMLRAVITILLLYAKENISIQVIGVPVEKCLTNQVYLRRAYVPIEGVIYL